MILLMATWVVMAFTVYVVGLAFLLRNGRGR
jgi:hypothetical protein